MTPTNAPRPWYREPLMWLVWGLPALTVPAGLATLALALDSPSPAVADTVGPARLLPTTDLAADEAARRLMLAGVLEVDPASANWRVTLAREWRGASLTLSLRHVTDPARDRTMELVRTVSGEFSATSPERGAGDYDIVLEAPQQAWRLVGRLDAGQASTALGARFPGG